jgi:hypothetical protein
MLHDAGMSHVGQLTNALPCYHEQRSIWKEWDGIARFGRGETYQMASLSCDPNVEDACFYINSYLACKTTLCRKKIGLSDLLEDPGHRCAGRFRAH